MKAERPSEEERGRLVERRSSFLANLGSVAPRASGSKLTYQGAFIGTALCCITLHLVIAHQAAALRSQPSALEPDLALTARVHHFRKWSADASAPASKVLKTLSPPFDEIQLANKETMRVEPVAEYLGIPPHFDGRIKVKQIKNGDKAAETHELTQAELRSWRPYEVIVLAELQALDQDKGIAILQRLQTAQRILVAVLYFHFERRDRPLDSDHPWRKLERQLRQRLLNVRIEFLKELVQLADLQTAKSKVIPFAEQLLDVYPQAREIRTQTAIVKARYTQSLIDQKEYKKAYSWLIEIERLDSESAPVKALRRKLEAKAPVIPGQRTLRVGVKDLPLNMSPALAWTDVEKQTLELLFERLVIPRGSDTQGPLYQPGLATSLPEVLPAGRRFSLPVDGFWSTGERVTVSDIRSTIELLRQSHRSGHSFLWNELVKPPQLTGDRLQVRFQFRQPFFDPLLPFTFRILPSSHADKPLLSAVDEDFARQPIGSGPFALLPVKENSGTVSFGVNPHYSAFRFDPPAFGRIDFQHVRDSISDFAGDSDPYHLVLGLTEEELAYLKSRNDINAKSLRNKRIYFLALNHRKQVLRNEDLRQAVAAALNKKAIVEQCFSGQDDAYQLLEVTGAALGVATEFLRQASPTRHRLLNGPFPAGAWACAPPSRVPLDLYDAGKAKTLFRKVKEKLPQIKLSLKYPDNDPRVACACERMAEQIRSAADPNLKFDLQLVALPPRRLYDAVQKGDYELAYYGWDFSSEYYWLWPLFDPRPEALGPNGSNFLGYRNDAALVSLLRSRMSHRDFRSIKAFSHNIHAHLYEKMPLIPLWQLDYHVALHPLLETGDLQPLRLFANVSDWKWKGP